jgi:D-3-phosphoglycerate dehydrogenase
MKILIADTIAESGIAQLEAAGHEIVQDKASGADLLDTLRTEKPHVLVVRSTKVNSDMMDANPSLELIVRAGAGYDTIDVDAASERGIFLSNCPGKNAVAVAIRHYSKWPRISRGTDWSY